MKTLRLAIGVALVVGGMVAGIGVTLHYFAEGILSIRTGHLREGLILLLLWSEVLGIVTTLSLVVPGIWLLCNIASREPTAS
jgi:hypothetical protein